MFGSLYWRAALACAALTVSGCAFTPETSRGVADSERSGSISRLSGGISSEARQQNRTSLIINFAFDSDQLDSGSMSKLDRQAAWILATPNARFSVTGHTDKVGDRAYNNDIGMRRAEAAVNYLAAKGIDQSRLVALISEGETRPVVDTLARERLNRRVETSLLTYTRPDRNDPDNEEFEPARRPWEISASSRSSERLSRSNGRTKASASRSSGSGEVENSGINGARAVEARSVTRRAENDKGTQSAPNKVRETGDRRSSSTSGESDRRSSSVSDQASNSTPSSKANDPSSSPSAETKTESADKAQGKAKGKDTANGNDEAKGNDTTVSNERAKGTGKAGSKDKASGQGKGKGNGNGKGNEKAKGGKKAESKGKGQGSRANSGRGNGAEEGDPGKSAGKNKGGDLD